MGRALNTYRGARRNLARERKIKFPWHERAIRRQSDHMKLEGKEFRQELPKLNPPDKKNSRNYRDRHPIKEKFRAKRNITMEFTGSITGLARAMVNHTIKTIFPGKSKRKWAAAIRAKPFRHYFADHPDKLKACQERHIHPRHKRPGALAHG
jgi:hypothetical protein